MKIWLFIKTTMCFIWFARCCCCRTHRSRCRLHSVEAAFTLCLAPGSNSLFFAPMVEVWKVKRKAKHTHYVERVWECERFFELHRMRRYGHFSRRPCALFASLLSFVLIVLDMDFTALRLCLHLVFTSVFVPGSSFLFHSHHNFCHFDVVKMRLLAMLQRWER